MGLIRAQLERLSSRPLGKRWKARQRRRVASPLLPLYPRVDFSETGPKSGRLARRETLKVHFTEIQPWLLFPLAHPTMAEGLTVLFAAVPARARATTQFRQGEREGEAAA